MDSQLKSILVIQTASIGDVILITSMLEKLHNQFPESNIDVLIKKENSALFNHHPFINNVWVWNKKEHKYRNLIDLIIQIRAKKYDLVVNVQRFFSSGLLTVLSNAKTTIGFSKNPLSPFFSKRVKHSIEKSGSMHEIERNHQLILHLTDSNAGKVKLYPSQNDEALTSMYKTKAYICIAPASLWFTKQYPVEKWIDLVTKIDNDILIYIVGGKSDIELANQIISKSEQPNCINLCGKFSLLQTASLMQHAIMNYVNDSAPMHLASSVNAKVCAIFCSTVPAFGFGPLSDISEIIETNEKLNCRPCGLHGHKTCPEGHFKCGYTIETQKLLNLINI